MFTIFIDRPYTMKRSYLIATFVIMITGCISRHEKHDLIASTNQIENMEKPAGVDTIIPTSHLPEFLEKKYALDPITEEDQKTAVNVERHDIGEKKIKTTSITTSSIKIDYIFTRSKKDDSEKVEIMVNGLTRSCVNEKGEPVESYGDLAIDPVIKICTIAGEKYILFSGTAVDAQSWFSTITYGMLARISGSEHITLLSTVSFPNDDYLTGDFYIRQNRFNGKVFSLVAIPASYDDKSYPDNISLTVKELNL